jgi:mitotic spindle assembly checkpoint protein MAD1
MKQSTTSRADINTEDLRAQLRTVQYELDSMKQERELYELHQQQELREAQNRAESDYKRAISAESARDAAIKKAEALARDFQDVQDRAANEKLQLEKKVRALQDDNRSLRDDLEEARADLESQDRQGKHAFSELEQKYSSLQASVEEIQQDLSGKVTALQTAQQNLGRKEAEVGELENEVLRLRAQTGDSDTLAVIKKELTEQVAYIKKLETSNREYSAEIKQFRKVQKGIEVVEEEKRALEAKVRMMDDLRKELAEAQLQKRILEDEKKGWSSYLETEAPGEDDLRYDTPEEMAKALLTERLEKLELLDKLGTIQPELSVKEENIRSLEDERARLMVELDTARSGTANTNSSSAADAKARARLERQKNLVVKEVEYLRAQMKTFEAEEAEFTPEQVDEERTKRIHELEDMIEKYRNEVATLQAELSKVQPPPAPIQSSPLKRSREEDEANDERLGELRRKTRSLQGDLEKLQSRNSLLEAELKASLSQITTLKSSSRTRVLELRSNPTADVEAIKLSTLNTLRAENAALLSQLEGSGHTTKVVPISTLDNYRHQLDDAKAQLAQAEKKTLRLKQIFSAKSLEFREAVCSILGWKLDFMPNGRVKATSILHPTSHVVGEDGEAEEMENSIVFDGENGTMKVSGGVESVFAGELRANIEFWVEGRREIPCFLAACTLDFWERKRGTMKI